MNRQRFPQQRCLQARPKQAIFGHEELSGPTELGRLGGHERNPKHCSSLEYGPSVCRTSSIRLPCVYYFFLTVVVIRYETTATARWALLFIVRAFFNDTVTVAVWTGFHVCASWGFIFARALLIRQWQRRSGKSSPNEFVTFWKKQSACPRRMSLACLR